MVILVCITHKLKLPIFHLICEKHRIRLTWTDMKMDMEGERPDGITIHFLTWMEMKAKWPLPTITGTQTAMKKGDVWQKQSGSWWGGDRGWPPFALGHVVYIVRWGLSFYLKKSKHGAVWLWIPARWTDTWPEHCHSDAARAASLLIKHKCINSNALLGQYGNVYHLLPCDLGFEHVFAQLYTMFFRRSVSASLHYFTV